MTIQYLYNCYELFLPLKLIKLRNFIFRSHLVLEMLIFAFFRKIIIIYFCSILLFLLLFL